MEYYDGNSINSNGGIIAVDGGWSQLANRKNSTTVDFWRDVPFYDSWSKWVTNPSTVGTLSTSPYLLGSISGISGFGSSSQMAFYSFGSQLTDTQAANYWTYVHTFNTTLSRAYET